MGIPVFVIYNLKYINWYNLIGKFKDDSRIINFVLMQMHLHSCI